jgi:hypothetical protein
MELGLDLVWDRNNLVDIVYNDLIQHMMNNIQKNKQNRYYIPNLMNFDQVDIYID